MFDIDTVLYDFFRQFSWLDLHDMTGARTAFLHFAISSWWAAGFSHLIRRHSRWWWLSLPAFVTLVFYQEAFADGHLFRNLAGTESLASAADLRADLITKLSGLVFYLLALF